MGRALLELLLPFLLPFAGYALLLLARRRFPAAAAAWGDGRLVRLAVVGLALAILSLLLFGLFGPRGRGDYVPAHVEGGRLVPGRMQ